MRNESSQFRSVCKTIGHASIVSLLLFSFADAHLVAANRNRVGRAPAPSRVKDIPIAPSNLSATATSPTTINLQWADNSQDEDNFILEYSPNGNDNWTQVDTPAADVMSADQSGLACATAHFYRISATNADGTSDPSNVASATTSACDNRTNIYLPILGKPPVVTQAARLVDVSISVYNSPSGAMRNNYEGFIRYFADGIYEMSNGAHKIRRVTVYTGGQKADQANIIWRGPGQCWPNATIAGYDVQGARVEMCDSNSSGEPYITDNDADQQNAGYTTAHEWGHYFYGISDEYRGSANGNAFGSLSPLPTDTEVQNSVMTQQRNAIQGTTSQGNTFNGDFNWLNFDTNINNTGNNAQFRLYNASGWDTLARPASADPRDGERTGYNVRIAYPELAAYAPPAGQAPRIELPDGRTAARSDLQIVWIDAPAAGANRNAPHAGTSRVVTQLVIGVSASTANRNKLDQIKAAARSWVGQANIGDVIGVITFDGVATTTLPLTVIANPSLYTTIYDVIDAIGVGNNGSATHAALSKALADFNTAGILSDTLRTVYLITDQPDTTDQDPLQVIDDYANEFVPIYSFGFGTSDIANSMLQDLAEETEGEFHFVSDVDELINALSEANQLNTPAVDSDIAEGLAEIGGGVPFTVPFHVDGGLGNIDVGVAHTHEPLSATLELVDPNGSNDYGYLCDTSSIDNADFAYCHYPIDEPVSGTWTLRVVATETMALEYSVVGTSRVDTDTFNTDIESVNGETLSAPTKLIVQAQVQREWPLTDVGISGTVEMPNGDVAGFTLRDDGIAPDRIAHDGIYRAELSYSAEGDYYITVRFDNHANTAKNTQYSVNLDGGLDGMQPPYRTPWLLGEDFERVATLQVLVE